MLATITKSWRFDAAQTDLELEAVPATQRMAIIYVTVAAKDSNSADVDVTIGLSTTTLPAISVNSGTGRPGIAFSHPGVAKGAVVGATMGGQPLVVGDLDADLLITNTIPTGGSIDVNVGYVLMEE
jgi:hypothetical protein